MSSSEQLVEQLGQAGGFASMSHQRKRGTSVLVPHPTPSVSTQTLALIGRMFAAQSFKTDLPPAAVPS